MPEICFFKNNGLQVLKIIETRPKSILEQEIINTYYHSETAYTVGILVTPVL